MSFTIDIGTESAKDVFRLWAAKPPLVGESCASWVQRLCGDHQYSFQILGRVLGYLPSRGDWDRPLDADVWQRVVGLVTFPELMQSHGQMVLLGAMSQAGKPEWRMWLVDKKPAYRWCPICFSEDETPYLRWYWRLESIRECWVHRTQLSEQCHACGQPLLMHRALLTRRSATFLSECSDCGMALSASVARDECYDRKLQRKLKTLFASWWRNSRPKRIHPKTINKIPFPISHRTQLAAARSEANARRRYELLKKEKFWVLDTNSFRQEATLKAEKTVAFRAPWQWRLGAKRRLAVADALRSIRKELRANQGEAGAAP